MDDEVLTPGTAARLLGVDPKTLTRWDKAGKIESFRTPGGHRRYRREVIDAIRNTHN